MFDDETLSGTTVADVLADPERYEGETLADPQEGIAYGRCKAKIMRRADGTPWINSYAHGRTVYELKLDYRAAETVLDATPREEAALRFVDLALTADLDAAETELLRNAASQRSGIIKPTLNRLLKEAKKDRATREARQRAEQRASERLDPRPQIDEPAQDAPWIPHQKIIEEVLTSGNAEHPDCRDTEADGAVAFRRGFAALHRLVTETANDIATDHQHRERAA